MNKMNKMNSIPCTCNDGIPCPICEAFKSVKAMEPKKKYLLNVTDKQTGQMKVLSLSESAYKRYTRSVERKLLWQNICMYVRDFFFMLGWRISRAWFKVRSQ